MKPLVSPIVNLNGTSREALVEQQCKVLEDLRALQKSMGDAAPNGRDFQTVPPAMFTAARDAWRERMQWLDTLYKEIEAHAIAIQQ